MIGLAAIAVLVAGQQAAPVFAPAGTHPYVIRSASMAPNLDEGDVILANRSRGECGTVTPGLGDVVIMRRGDTPWVRRIVAGPGQTVQMIDGELHLDGVAVPRERAAPVPGPQFAHFGALAETMTVWRESLPGGRTYLTLDFGPGGMLDDTAPVTVPEGHWFTLGDSRDNAVDSRLDGPTAAHEVCGVVLQVVRSADPARAGVRP